MVPRLDVLVVGGGALGLCAALAAREHHDHVAVVARDDGCSRHAGGMLAPVCELDHAPPAISRLGLDAPARWRALLGDRATGVLEVGGSVLVAHPPERRLLDHLVDRIGRAGFGDRVRALDRDGLRTTAPALADRFARAVAVEGEGVVHPRRALPALRAALAERGVEVARGEATSVAPGRAVVGDTPWTADVVIDARGLDARHELPLRGVRGEYAIVAEAEVDLPCPVRVLHPRYPLYVVPRPDGTLYLGATTVERDEHAPPTARGVLELLSALVSLHPALAEVTVVETGAARRPALPHNLPTLTHEPGLVRVNGAYRHGWLLAPRLGAAAVALATGHALDAEVGALRQEAA